MLQNKLPWHKYRKVKKGSQEYRKRVTELDLKTHVGII